MFGEDEEGEAVQVDVTLDVNMALWQSVARKVGVAFAHNVERVPGKDL